MISLENKKIVINAFVSRSAKTNYIGLVEALAFYYNLDLADLIEVILDSKNVRYLYSKEDIEKYKYRKFIYINELLNLSIKCDEVLNNYKSGTMRNTMGVSLSTASKSYKNFIYYSKYSDIFRQRHILRVTNPEVNKIYVEYEKVINYLLSTSKTILEKKSILSNLSKKDLLLIEKFLVDYFAKLESMISSDNEEYMIVYKNELLGLVRDCDNSKKTENKIEKTKRYIPSSEDYISAYVNSGMFLACWLNKYKVGKDRFEKAVNDVKESNFRLYEEYIQIKSNEEKAISNMTNSISYYFENGIKVSDTETREFTILDFYAITNLSLRDFGIIIRNAKLDVKVLTNIKKFLAKNKETNKIDESYINSLNIHRKFGKESRDLTSDEKVSIIEYMKDNNIPMNDSAYMTIVNEYSNGRLLLPQTIRR